MRITGLTFGLVGAIALAGIAASVVIQQTGQAKLGEKAEAAQQQAEQLTRLTAENERLSNLVAWAASPQVLSPDQLRELLRLRGQIGGLRQTAKEHAQLEAVNQQLRAAQASAEQKLAAAQAAPNFWAKDQLAFAGYADPEAALKSLLWAMRNGDLKAYLACWASGPDVNVILASQGGDKTEAELAAQGKMLSDSLAPAVGFHILETKTKSAEEVILNLSFDGEGKARKFVVKRIGNEWKLADMLLPGEEEE